MAAASGTVRVRYYGHVGQRTGYGRAAEVTCLAMLAAGIDLEIRPLAPSGHLDLTRPGVLPLAACLKTDGELSAPDITFVHTLPYDCYRVVQIAKLVDCSMPIVAYTTWEGAGQMTPPFIKALRLFDMLYFPSRHNLTRAVLGGELRDDSGWQADQRFGVLPHAFDPRSAEGLRGSQQPPADGRFRFYYLGAWAGRKNPAGVIRAYISEFKRDEPVELVMQCSGAGEADFVMAAHSTGLERHEMPRIDFRNQFATDADIVALHRDSDCFVTATRGEAWNLPAFDAMIAGRHVIAPMQMGHQDFLQATSAALYCGSRQPAQGDVRITEHGPPGALRLQFVGAHGLTGLTSWQEPDLYQLATTMRHAFDGRRRNLTVYYDPLERYNYETVGRALRASLETLGNYD